MYAGLGLSAIIFVVHGLFLYGYETQKWRMSVDWMAAMAGFNLVGALIYGIRVSPELSGQWYNRMSQLMGHDRFQKSGTQENLIYSLTAIRCCTWR